MQKIKIPTELQKMNSLFESSGFEAYLVGGAVRDEIMGKGAHDWDIATNAKPEEVMKIFHRVIPTGIKHGTVTVHFMKKAMEVTTFRTESDYSDGRHPDKVEYAGKIEEDLSRRDFTMNAMAANLKDGSIVDPYGGKEDIKNKIIRTVGIPHERFMEDGLRPVRAIRFASQLGFKIEENTFKDILNPETQMNVSKISAERFRDEFCKILLSKIPSEGLLLLEETGLLKIFIPELLLGRDCVQSDDRGFHDFDVLDHNFFACDGAALHGNPDKDLILRLAALFHDVGKPEAKRLLKVGEDAQPMQEKITFYNHEAIGAKIANNILTRLKFSNAQIQIVCHLIKEHMFNYESSWSDAAVRRFIQRIGNDNIDALFDLRLADIYGMHKTPVRLHDTSVCGKLLELKERIEGVLQEKSAMSLKDLAVSGDDLIKAGIPAGKKMGMILRELFESVTEDPQMNQKDILLNLAKNIYKEKFN